MREFASALSVTRPRTRVRFQTTRLQLVYPPFTREDTRMVQLVSNPLAHAMTSGVTDKDGALSFV
jgi:hypothetical protein